MELDSYNTEYVMAMQIVQDACEEVCNEMWLETAGRRSIGVVQVWCLRDGKPDTCNLLRIGTYWRSPSFEVMMETEDRVLKYGIVEEPNWFPLYGMY